MFLVCKKKTKGMKSNTVFVLNTKKQIFCFKKSFFEY